MKPYNKQNMWRRAYRPWSLVEMEDYPREKDIPFVEKGLRPRDLKQSKCIRCETPYLIDANGVVFSDRIKAWEINAYGLWRRDYDKYPWGQMFWVWLDSPCCKRHLVRTKGLL